MRGRNRDITGAETETGTGQGQGQGQNCARTIINTPTLRLNSSGHMPSTTGKNGKQCQY